MAVEDGAESSGMDREGMEMMAAYRRAVEWLGRRCVSSKLQAAGRSAGSDDVAGKREVFMDDCMAYLEEIEHGEVGIPKIGGTPVDLYRLLIVVMRRGGLQRVINRREFKAVARVMDLPRGFVSAAYVLRVSYERLLYVYEQKLVFGRRPAELPPIIHPSGSSELDARSEKSSKDPVFARPQTVVVVPVPRPRGRPPKDSKAPVPPVTKLRAAAPAPVESLLKIQEQRLPLRPDVRIPWEDGRFRSHVVLALQSGVFDQISWALGLVNALSFDSRRELHVAHFPGVLDGLALLLEEFLEDVYGHRLVGWTEDDEYEASTRPREAVISSVEIGSDGGKPLSRKRRLPSLMDYGDLFNTRDSLGVERERRAMVSSCALRNMSFTERNGLPISENVFLMMVMRKAMTCDLVPLQIRHNLIDVWLNLAPMLSTTEGATGCIVLETVVDLLNAPDGGGSFSLRCTEILARLAANPEKNEDAITAQFDSVLPPTIDMLEGGNSKEASAAMSFLCNVSAFDWPARGKLAQVPRAVSKFVSLLSESELASRAALAVLNLAEAPQNRNLLLQYEGTIAERALTRSPAAETLASILSELTDDY